MVFLDYNADGVQGPGEPALGGMATYLDSNDDARLDPGEASFTTASNGSCTFTNLNPASYVVRRAFEPGHGIVLTSPTRLAPNLASGGNVTGQNFGEVFISQVAPVEVAANRFGASSSVETAFVHGLYVNLLNREPDTGGLAFWAGMMAAGTDAATVRQEVTRGIWTSPEHRGLQVDHYYDTFLRRQADPGGRAYFISQFLSGASEQAIVLDLILSREYQQINNSPEAFVQALYKDVLSRDRDEAGLQYWLNVLHTSNSLFTAQAIITSDESLLRIADGFYSTFLHRPGDAVGRDYWLNQLRTSQHSIETVAEGFLAGNAQLDEYFAAAVSSG